MKEKFLKALKDLFPSVKADILDRVAEAFASTATDDNLETVTKSDGVKNLINQFQVEGDKRATEAGKTAVTTYRKKHNLDENGKPITEPTPDPNPDPDEPAWFKAYREKQQQETEALKTKLEGYEKRETQETLKKRVLETVREGLKTDAEKKGFDAWVEGRPISIDTEDKLEEISGTLGADFGKYRQKVINQGAFTEIPPDGSGNTEKTVEEYQKIMNGENADEDPGTVKLDV